VRLKIEAILPQYLSKRRVPFTRIRQRTTVSAAKEQEIPKGVVKLASAIQR